jgi:AcrR family transcriptional regulator
MARDSRTRPRKSPSQRRSRITVDAVLEAAARVFEERGYAGGTTNRIAERAGVSVGSLYEYFPSKDAIVVALVERQLEDQRRSLCTLLEEAPPGGDLADLLSRFVAAVIDFHARRPSLHRILFEEAAHPPEAHACVLRHEEALAHALEAALRREGLAIDDPDTAAHLVVQTAECLAHRFVLRGIHDLDRETFAAELTRLLARYLGVG